MQGALHPWVRCTSLARLAFAEAKWIQQQWSARFGAMTAERSHSGHAKSVSSQAAQSSLHEKVCATQHTRWMWLGQKHQTACRLTGIQGMPSNGSPAGAASMAPCPSAARSWLSRRERRAPLARLAAVPGQKAEAAPLSRALPGGRQEPSVPGTRLCQDHGFSRCLSWSQTRATKASESARACTAALTALCVSRLTPAGSLSAARGTASAASGALGRGADAG